MKRRKEREKGEREKEGEREREKGEKRRKEKHFEDFAFFSSACNLIAVGSFLPIIEIWDLGELSVTTH